MAAAAVGGKRKREPRASLPLHEIIAYCRADIPGWSVYAAELEPLMTATLPFDGVPAHVQFACPCRTLRGKPPVALKRREDITTAKLTGRSVCLLWLIYSDYGETSI